MIRANLLPRRRATIALFSFEIELGFLQEIGAAIAIVAAVAGIGIEIERMRVDRLASTATELESRVAANATAREESHRLMLDLARYQEYEREASEYRRSGAVAAEYVAQIGNSIPANVWLDEIARADDGYSIVGGSRTVDALARAIVALGRARPGERASIVRISSRERSDSSVHFSARLMPREPDATPAAALRQPENVR